MRPRSPCSNLVLRYEILQQGRAAALALSTVSSRAPSNAPRSGSLNRSSIHHLQRVLRVALFASPHIRKIDRLSPSPSPTMQLCILSRRQTGFARRDIPNNPLRPTTRSAPRKAPILSDTLAVQLFPVPYPSRTMASEVGGSAPLRRLCPLDPEKQPHTCARSGPTSCDGLICRNTEPSQPYPSTHSL
jgi:hypothetical protein